MTAKQYLQQAFRLNVKIKSCNIELQHLRELSTCLPGTDYSQERVQTSGNSDRTANTIAKIVDLENEIQAKIDKMISLKREIRERIEMMSDDDLQLILESRYINFQKWKQIAVDLDFTHQWVHTLHNRALKNFEQLIVIDSQSMI